jgi:hypothetical protein
MDSEELKAYRERIRTAALEAPFSLMNAGHAAVAAYLGCQLVRCECLGDDYIWKFLPAKDDWRTAVKDFDTGKLMLTDARAFWESCREVMNARLEEQ